MTFARVALLALVVLWSVDALTWARALPSFLAWTVVMLRVVVFATLAVVAVRQGRRWSAPLAAGLIAGLAVLAPLVVFVLSGSYAARGAGPAYVWAALVYGLAVAFATIILATLGALLWQRRAHDTTVGAI